MSKSIYLAGPMSGKPNLNFEAFNTAAARFREEGWEVFNPAEIGDQVKDYGDSFASGDTDKAMAAGFNFREVYTWDVCKVIEADAIFMLPGWENSAGARGEYAIAVAMQKYYPEYKIFYEEPRNMTFADLGCDEGFAFVKQVA